MRFRGRGLLCAYIFGVYIFNGDRLVGGGAREDREGSCQAVGTHVREEAVLRLELPAAGVQ